MSRTLQCFDQDFDPHTGTCAAPFYGEPSTFELSISDAQQIGYAIAFLWAAAWGIRQLKRMLR